MLDIKFIRDNRELVKAGVINKNADPELVDNALTFDEQRRILQAKADDLRAKRKTLGRDAIDEARALKQALDTVENELNTTTETLNSLLRQIPNIPYEDVPVGKNDEENVVVRRVGDIPELDFEPKDHMELGLALNLLDTQKASQISGARFAYIKGRLVQVQFALIQYALSVLTNETKLAEIAEKANLTVPAKPFTPVVPPVMLRPEVMDKMARLEPKDDRYYIPSDDLYLVGSAEHTLGPLHMDETLAEKDLPIRYLGYSTAFRREAGTYGKDTKGILRVHQFDKLEMESFTTPESSFTEHQLFVAIEEYFVQSLGLAYQVIASCTGDLGDPNARKLDIEVWVPSQQKYRETHSADYMTDYQARRLNIKVKRANGETQYVHMNDATAFAIGRTLIAIMENYQQADGSIRIPDVLAPFCGFNEIR